LADTSEETGAGGHTIRLFDKWGFDEVAVQDLGLKQYIQVQPIFIPHSGGRHEHQRFEKSKLNVVERLTNNMMRHGRNCGKKAKAISIVKMAFEIIHLKTGRNPVQILVDAIERSAPCEDTTRIGYGGIVYHRAVDISPQRRVDIALRFLTEGARRAAFGNRKTIEECLADELMAAAEGDTRSNAVSRRDEMERVALASR
jgi:small subunit ribosomal protein S7